VVGCVAAALSAACVGDRPEAPARATVADCTVSVIVRFAREPDATLLANLGHTHALALEPIGAITGDLGVYLLSVDGGDAECRDAIDRLRTDASVRSVDIDTRREVHGRE
jgi:hypothetical protein